MGDKNIGSGKHPKPVAVVSSASGHPVRKWLGIVAVGLLVVAAIGAAVWNFMQKPETANIDANQKRSAVLQNVAEANRDRDYNQEAKLLQEYVDSDPPGELASQEIIRLGAAYVNAKDYDNAIKTYQTALDKYPENKYVATRSLGITYLQRGEDNADKADFQKALTYFEQALELAKADPDKRSVVPADESNIRYVKAKLQ